MHLYAIYVSQKVMGCAIDRINIVYQLFLRVSAQCAIEDILLRI